MPDEVDYVEKVIKPSIKPPILSKTFNLKKFSSTDERRRCSNCEDRRFQQRRAPHLPGSRIPYSLLGAQGRQEQPHRLRGS